jgi:FkbM family methyltransferase
VIKLEDVTRLYPLYKGRGRFALSRFRRNSAGADGEPLRVALLTGEKIYVFENDYIGRMVRFFGDLDPAVSGIVRKIVRPGDVVLDIGANIGLVTLQMASIVGAEGHVFAFEPIKRLSALMSRSAAENHFENVTVHNVALSDLTGSGSMKVADSSLGCSTLSFNIEGEPCDIKMLDEIDFGPHFRRPRLLKIDVEGHESKVFAGGRTFLEKYSPDYILFESHAERGRFWDRPEVRLLLEYGYGFAAILRSAFARPVLREVVPGDSNLVGSDDFLATRKGLS